MNIDDRLAALRLHGMRHTWQALTETRQHLEISLPDGMEMLLQAEDAERDNKRSERLLKQAGFRYSASLEELNYASVRGIDKQLVAQLAQGDYIRSGTSVLITGATGCGKSYLACALGYSACARGHRVAYYNMQKLLVRCKIARAEGAATKFFDSIRRRDLLIIEDWYGRAATIIASQLAVASWFEVIGEETIADAILDRLVHTSHRIELKGDSLRKKR